MIAPAIPLYFLLGVASAMSPSADNPVEPQTATNPGPARNSAASREPAPDDPYARRPVCESLFLASEWQLSPRQKGCDWIQNRVLSTSALAGALWSAATSPIWNTWVGGEETTNGFMRRFETDFAQNAFKSTGAYLGGMVFHEDPREAPPYLIMSTKSRPRGFVKRTAHALAANVLSFRCDNACTREADIKRVPAVSRIVGSLASGFSVEVWADDRSNANARAWRGTATAYGATFASSLFTEFKPEISAFAGRLFTIFGVK